MIRLFDIPEWYLFIGLSYVVSGILLVLFGIIIAYALVLYWEEQEERRMNYIDKYRECEDPEVLLYIVKQDILSALYFDGDPDRVKLKAIRKALNEIIAEREEWQD